MVIDPGSCLAAVTVKVPPGCLGKLQGYYARNLTGLATVRIAGHSCETFRRPSTVSVVGSGTTSSE